ncbi:hypothetical protein KC221_31305, partial [Mycobacterium tuberculosis]|nr:hypothetical protein [Mycobacterium tuberculosis]
PPLPPPVQQPVVLPPPNAGQNTVPVLEINPPGPDAPAALGGARFRAPEQALPDWAALAQPYRRGHCQRRDAAAGDQ